MNSVLGEDDLSRSPAWFPLRPAGNGDVDMVHLTEEAYRAISFLDERILALRYAQTTCERSLIEAIAARLAPRAHYVFHTGHVGSTLISRLIGVHRGFFSLREPKLLRDLAGEAGGGPVTLAATLALLSRTWRAEQRAVIKTTSFVSELAELILAGQDRPAAIFMYTSPQNYVRGILGGPNSRVEAKALAPARLRRLARRLGTALQPAELELRSEGEFVAMSWLCEMTALHQAAKRFESQVLWVDFDEFLKDPKAGLERIFRALGAAPSSNEIETIATSPMMQQYSKAPEHAYDAALRQEVLQSADWEHGSEIRRGMEWLGAAAGRHALVSDVTASSR